MFYPKFDHLLFFYTNTSRAEGSTQAKALQRSGTSRQEGELPVALACISGMPRVHSPFVLAALATILHLCQLNHDRFRRLLACFCEMGTIEAKAIGIDHRCHSHSPTQRS